MQIDRNQNGMEEETRMAERKSEKKDGQEKKDKKVMQKEKVK